MLKRLENKLMMLKAVLNLLKQNSEKLSIIPALTGMVEKLTTLISEIETLRQVTEGDRTGITAEKRAQEELLIDRTYEVSSALYAMASAGDDNVLQNKVDFTESDLDAERGNDLVATCTSVIALARENLEGLADYGITEAEVTELESQNAAFSESLPDHRVSVSERKAANQKMKAVFGDADELLNDQIDRLMVRIDRTSPDLFAAYTNARKLVNYGIRHEQDEQTEENP